MLRELDEPAAISHLKLEIDWSSNMIQGCSLDANYGGCFIHKYIWTREKKQCFNVYKLNQISNQIKCDCNRQIIEVLDKNETTHMV